MKKIVILFIGLFISVSSTFSLEIIKEAGISFELEDENWYKASQTFGKDDYTCFYKRGELFDSMGNERRGRVEIYVNKVDTTDDVVVFSTGTNLLDFFHVEQVTGPGAGILGIENSILYQGTFSDPFGDYKGYAIHALKDNKGYMIFIFSHQDIYEDIQDEIEKILTTIKFIE